MTNSLPPATIINTEVRDFHSTIMGINYQISTWFPPDYPKSGYKYPVIYLTDGEILLGQIAPMVLFLIWGKMVPECLIVGLGHPVSKIEEWVKVRDIDYDPPESPGGDPEENRADDFLAFLKKELIPFIETTYPADPTDRCLAGFSAGGVFTLYTFLHEPDLFLRYLIGSATFESMLPHFLEYEQQLAEERTALPVHVFLSAGGLEEDVVPGLHQFIATLKSRNYEGLRLDTLVDEGEGHLSTSPTAFCKGFKALYKPIL
jgi:predicted alpha/beta superfamily hydrolase